MARRAGRAVRSDTPRGCSTTDPGKPTERLERNMPTPMLIKTRGGIGAAVWLCFLTLGTGGAWAVVAATNPSSLHPPPAPTLGTTPPVTTKQVWAAFSFIDHKRRIYFQCSLDGAPFRDCSSPVRYGPALYVGRAGARASRRRRRGAGSNGVRARSSSQRPALALGSHTFKVRAVLGKLWARPRPTRGRSSARGNGSAGSPAPASTPASAPASSPSSPPATPPPTGGGSAPWASR